ncbi:hypothetical protein SAMN05444266_110137 [Chitinophaga jiangningensis]|uniref:Uncharacterized protein n=1 Tax=Chitinophaga jiangningensis TaxID=1419482 RepID=A0A1M7L5H1_9BACT|nr:hypothetical protein [Chitinophaga jiangningensis]SHM72973.1 hypothetical protein SAMN05444266_110137 [Chitinophaga jiangningensis]
MKNPVLKALCLGVCAAALVACNKEVINEPRMRGPVDESTGTNPGNTDNPLIGTYKVVASTDNGRGETRSNMMGVAMLSVMNTQVTCDNFTGTVIIDAQKMTAKDMGMSFNLAYTVMQYMGGVEVGPPETGTHSEIIPAQNSSAPYTLKGKDSISCALVMPPGVGEALGAAGASLPATKMQHYAFSGDTLILTANWVVNQTLTISGVSADVSSSDLSEMKLVRISK